MSVLGCNLLFAANEIDNSLPRLAKTGAHKTHWVKLKSLKYAATGSLVTRRLFGQRLKIT